MRIPSGAFFLSAAFNSLGALSGVVYGLSAGPESFASPRVAFSTAAVCAGATVFSVSRGVRRLKEEWTAAGAVLDKALADVREINEFMRNANTHMDELAKRIDANSSENPDFTQS